MLINLTNTNAFALLSSRFVFSAPTWEQMAVDLQDLEDTKHFKFAEVNCLMEGDICDDNNVRGYPSLQL